MIFYTYHKSILINVYKCSITELYPTDSSLKSLELSQRSFVFSGQRLVLPDTPSCCSRSEHDNAAQNCCSNRWSDGYFLNKIMCVFNQKNTIALPLSYTPFS
jgi:hypothetical protein